MKQIRRTLHILLISRTHFLTAVGQALTFRIDIANQLQKILTVMGFKKAR